MKIDTETSTDLRNQNMAINNQIDNNLINYSWVMTYCQNSTSWCPMVMKIGTETFIDLRNQTMAINSQIDSNIITYA